MAIRLLHSTQVRLGLRDLAAVVSESLLILIQLSHQTLLLRTEGSFATGNVHGPSASIDALLYNVEVSYFSDILVLNSVYFIHNLLSF